jgi:hypothetical protein
MKTTKPPFPYTKKKKFSLRKAQKLMRAAGAQGYTDKDIARDPVLREKFSGMPKD